MSFSDITLTCKDCGNPFVFTAGEQEFYQQRGLMNQPGRCSDCRAARKASGGGASYGGSRGGVEMRPALGARTLVVSRFEM